MCGLVWLVPFLLHAQSMEVDEITVHSFIMRPNKNKCVSGNGPENFR